MFCRSLAAIFFPCAHLSLPRCSLADSPVSQCVTCPPAIPCAISHLTGRHRSLQLSHSRYLPERFSDQRAAPDGIVNWLNRCRHGSYGWST
ncbi:hypothetical protein DFH06DRAFT_1238120 [Mycena polygramma]|nr:hypothetical protein DFH06DRAFT_1238120 [Mycena polygramma]